jgi:hypothetical protein
LQFAQCATLAAPRDFHVIEGFEKSTGHSGNPA